MTGGTRQSDVYSQQEWTCYVKDIKLLCVCSAKQPNSPEFGLYYMLLICKV